MCNLQRRSQAAGIPQPRRIRSLCSTQPLQVLLAWLFSAILATVTAQTPEAVEHYENQVRPVLRERCISCHGALRQEGGLRLDTATLLHQGGSSGPAVVPTQTESSLLIQRVQATDPEQRMPPEGSPLTPAQIQALRDWITAGAPSPQGEVADEDPRQHWAFQRLQRPAVPWEQAGMNADSGHPVDAFLEAARRRAGVVSMPETDPATLLRRVTLDLTGLPPTSDELEAFLQDHSPEAFQRVVDRLLSTPQHGERWARHWMDVWRYSDWYGRRSVPDVMNSYPMIWRWRDWIVNSLNADRPYDQMIVEMLAADELTPDDHSRTVATGFLVRSWFKWNYETWKKDLVEHTGKAFLGLTLNCCQCHDHKYDPLTQEEYFRFRAFFEPLELRHDRFPGEPDPGPFVKYVYANSYGPISSGMVRVFDEYLDAETFVFAKGDARLTVEGRPPVTPGAPAVLLGESLQTSRQLLPITAAYPGMKDFIRNEERQRRESERAAAMTALTAARSDYSQAPQTLHDELQTATAALDSARAEAVARLQESAAAGDTQVLQGTQSLFLDARVGRRALSHTLPGIDALGDNGTVTFLLKIVQDGHTNLQLGLDIAQGATGGYVGFEGGQIRTYQPGGFQEFTAGHYDMTRGQSVFAVTMALDLPQNQFLLTVKSLSDNSIVVDRVPAALNGWRPVANGRRGLFIDARPGTAAVYDAIEFRGSGEALLVFHFEAPDYIDGQEIVYCLPSLHDATWLPTAFCQAPATSLVISSVSADPAVQAAVVRLTAARQALRLPELRVQAAEQRLKAAEADILSLESRIAADDLRYATGRLADDRRNDPSVRPAIDDAINGERLAAVALAQSRLTSAELAVADAEMRLSAAEKSGDAAAKETAVKDQQTGQAQQATATTQLQAARAALSQPADDYTSLSPKYPQESSGRRSALAHWIADERNPLTARVAVNHIWLRHTGQALVETTHDFGRNGSRPSHPELLDWLAMEFMDSGWSMKHLHRLIVTSQFYRLTSLQRQSAGPLSHEQQASAIRDPDNRSFWKFPESRMQAEVVRDSLLAVAGALDTTMGGPEIDHREGLKSQRRSLYFAHHGEEKMEFLELFDAANACDCYRRTSSVQPQQALALTNSELTATLSVALADRLWQQASSENEPLPRFVRLSFLQILNRPPADRELQASLQFLNSQADELATATGQENLPDPAGRSRQNLVHALMNHNDFVTVR